MKELVNTNPEPQKNSTPNSLDEFLKGYTPDTKPVSIPSATPTPQTISAPFVQTIEYYKTGKKAGQPKPNRNKQPAYVPPTTTTNVQPVNNTVNGTLITGALFIMLIDLVMPALIAFINNQTTKVQIKASTLGLDDKQKKDFEKLADEAVKQLNIQANPMILLSISMGGIYMMNVFLQRSLEEERMKLKKPAPNSKPVY